MSYDFISNPEEAKDFGPRYRALYTVIFLSFLIFVMRLWYLQVIEGAELREFSEKNRIKQIKIMAPRGIIYDRNGEVLVENHPGFEAVFLPQFTKDLPAIAEQVAPIIGMTPERFITKYNRTKRMNGPFAPIRMKENLSKDEVFRLKRLRLEIPGLDIRETVVRFFPLNQAGAQVFGYVAEISKRQIPTFNEKFKGQITFEQGDKVGNSGLEESFEKYLRGLDGTQFVQVDAFGRETANIDTAIFSDALKPKEPTLGYDMSLTIDRDLQQATYDSFIKHERMGSVVAMKADGEILSWVNNPSFDPNDFSRGITNTKWSELINDPFKPMRNKAIQDHYSPGSTFKPFLALAALQEKLIKPSTLINCPGSFVFGRRPYHDHNKQGHGNITVYEAIERSSNVFFYKMGLALGIEKMYSYVSSLGVGVRTGIEVPREVAGRMPNSEWKKKAFGEEWQQGEDLSTAIGQGFVQTTPLQMAVAYNAIGTGGKIVKPFVVRKIVNKAGATLVENKPVLVRDLSMPQVNGIHIDAENFAIVKEAMRRVVQGDRGTAKSVRLPGVEIAGKTGTSQVMNFSADQIYAKCGARPMKQRHHGWFVAWAPADNPEITVAALAEHSCSGSGGAGPLVKDVMRAYFNKYHPGRITEDSKNAKAAPAAPIVEGE